MCIVLGQVEVLTVQATTTQVLAGAETGSQGMEVFTRHSTVDVPGWFLVYGIGDTLRTLDKLAQALPGNPWIKMLSLLQRLPTGPEWHRARVEPTWLRSGPHSIGSLEPI